MVGESFNSRVRDELLAVESFSYLAEVKVLIEDYRQDSNRCRPHLELGMMTLATVATGGGPPMWGPFQLMAMGGIRLRHHRQRLIDVVAWVRKCCRSS